MRIQTLSLPEQVYLFAQISNIAYLDPDDAYPEFKGLGFDAEFFDNGGSQAYLLDDGRDLVVACRGTEPTEWADIAADLKFRWVPSSTGTGKVHRGFKGAADKVYPKIAQQLEPYGKTKLNCKPIYCTGHSLGAAMATLIAYRLKRADNMPDPTALFTFGSPKVGNAEYVAAIKETGLPHYRVVNNNDVVTQVPPWPFKHYGDMIYFNHWGNKRDLTVWQRTKDRFRGFMRGIKKLKIDNFSDHSMTEYCENLRCWNHNIEKLEQEW